MGGADLAVIDLEIGNLSETKTSLNDMLEECRLGAKMVRQLQTFANVRSDPAPIKNRVIDLSHLARQAAEATELSWKTGSLEHGPLIDMKLDLEKRCCVQGSRSKLFEVLVNLIKNAVEAMPDGGGLRIKTAVDQDTVTLTVQDTGVGIPEEKPHADIRALLDHQRAEHRRGHGTCRELRDHSRARGLSCCYQ